MPYVAWSEMFVIDKSYIDKQHQKLLEITNDFHAALKAQKGREAVFEILNALIRYVEEHFRDEEEIMQKIQYPSELTEAHKKIHEGLVGDIFKLHAEFGNAQEKTLREVEAFLSSWLIQHILIEDKKLQPYMKNV
jgi:hemerythrin